jgi:hypothetical protein
MNIQQRLFLVFTLSVLLLGLVAHSIPSVCSCVVFSESRTGSSDTCMVCQLQAGAQVSSLLMLSPDRETSDAVSSHFPIPLEYSIPVFIPPIRF